MVKILKMVLEKRAEEEWHLWNLEFHLGKKKPITSFTHGKKKMSHLQAKTTQQKCQKLKVSDKSNKILFPWNIYITAPNNLKQKHVISILLNMKEIFFAKCQS